ncbi:MAG: aldo/keto reductase [Chloroflexi bacterium]|nr:aldo/keto reductase [Chloroflexota bacterium]
MRYRRLGRTELQVSEIGIGGGGLRCSTAGYAVELLRRALELGVNYIDTATAYGDSETKVGLALQGRRKDAVIATKLDAVTAAEGESEFAASLERLRTDYVDVLHLHGVQDLEDLDRRMASGGVFDVLRRAKRDGRARFVGVTGHRHEVLVEALQRDVFDVTLFIMNIAEQDATKELIPLALRKNIGMTVMKPLATGLLPSKLALRYLLAHPVGSVVPSGSTIEWLESNVAVSDMSHLPLTAEEQAEIERLHRRLAHVRCRICGLCDPCPQGIKIGDLLGTYRFYNEFRSRGREGVLSFQWGDWARANFPKELEDHLAAIARCDDCRECEPRCPHQLPIVSLLRDMVPAMQELKSITAIW